MKNLEREKIAKKIISIILILSIVVPYLPLSVFATEGENNSNTQKVDFTANWTSGKAQEEGTTNDTFYLNYDVKFNNVQTGFQDVKLVFDTNKLPGVYDKITLINFTGTTAQSQGEANGHAEIKLRISKPRC